MFNRLIFAFMALALVESCADHGPASRSDAARPQLIAGPRFIESTNGLHVRIEAPSLRLIRPESRRDTFHGHAYEISLAGFVSPDVAVLVHGERVADASGASNYDNLAAADWPSAAFRSRRSCVTLTAEDIQGEHDLEWLRAAGFDPVGALVLDQAFLTTPDHNNEVVISVAVKGVDCDLPQTVSESLRQAQSRVHVTVRR